MQNASTDINTGDIQKRDYMDVAWQVDAIRVGSGPKAENADSAAPSWNVAAELVQIQDVDYRMMKKALRSFRKYAVELLSFTRPDRVEAFKVNFDEFVAAHFKTQAMFESEKYELYFSNSENASVPIVARVENDEAAVFWFFKDGLIEN